MIRATLNMSYARPHQAYSFYPNSKVWDYKVQFNTTSEGYPYEYPIFQEPINCDFVKVTYNSNQQLINSGIQVVMDPSDFQKVLYPLFSRTHDSLVNSTRYNARILYLSQQSMFNVLHQQAEVTHTVDLTLPSFNIQLQPKYTIIPYFILQGQNDSGNQVYVQRFNGMTFEHNFLYDGDKLVNHIKEQFSEDDIIKASPCSYSEQTPFKYVNSDYTSDSTMTLEPGIYVLNIQRCPGVSNWTQKGTNTTLLRLEIQVGDNTYTYDLNNKKTSIKNWSISAQDTNGTVYEPAGYSRMRIYTPIVIVINSNKPVSIKIDATKPDGHKFTRQSMGLHQIKDITENDILSLNVDKEVYLYHDYMNLIKESSNRLSEVKQYAFIQKYGVFFKEAFVFVDGVFNDENKQVEDITIGEKTYEAWPYIPSDTSILPVGLQKDNNYYWNTYYMPKSILSENSENSEFIFSNADDISTITTSLKPINGGILRQLINQE